MRIRAKGPIKHLGKSGHHYDLLAGDEVTLRPGDESDGDMMVLNGWAVNVETGEDNAPLKNPHTLVHGDGESVLVAPVGDTPEVKPADTIIPLGTEQ